MPAAAQVSARDDPKLRQASEQQGPRGLFSSSAHTPHPTRNWHRLPASASGLPLQPTLSARRREGRPSGLFTPGGSDLTAVVNRNAEKLRVLRHIPECSTEALDEWIATFVAKSGQVGVVRSC